MRCQPFRPVHWHFLVALVACAFAWGTSAQAEPARRALLIGINEYQELPDLRGAINDLDLMEGLLTSRFGFAPENITRVTDTQATRAGILRALDELAERVQPEDVVYIHYSGHGSQAKDYDGDEQDERDETLVPHDGRTEGVPDITDDELATALERIDAQSLVVVLDSCHSGTATRSVSVQARAVPIDTRSNLYVKPKTRAVVALDSSEYVLMTGASSDQEALDGPVDGRLHGLFTYSLARSLSSAPVDADPRTVLGGVGQELQRIKAQLGLRSMPEPQLEAEEALLEAVMFPAPGAAAGASAEGTPRLAWVEARMADDGRARLVDGVRLGAVVGSVWGIYPPGELEFPPGRAVAQMRIEAVEGDDALGELVGASSVPDASRAIEVAPPPAEQQLAVRFEDTDTERGQRIRRAITARLPDVTFVPAERFSRFSVQNAGDRSRVYAADGMTEVVTLAIESDAQLADALVTIFSRSITAAELLSLDNPAAEMELELAVALDAAERDQMRGLQVVSDAPVYRIRKPDEPRTEQNSIQLIVEASSDCYLTIVDVDAEGAVNQLFPNVVSEARSFYPDGRIEAATEVRIPDSLRSGNRAGFHLDVAPPSGTDTVRALCAADREVAAAVRDTIASLAGRTSDRGAVRAALVDRLHSSLAGSATRGIRIVADAGPEPDPGAEPESGTAATPDPTEGFVAPGTSGDWVATSITLEVAE